MSLASVGYITYEKFFKEKEQICEEKKEENNSFKLFAENMKKKIATYGVKDEEGITAANEGYIYNVESNNNLTYTVSINNKGELYISSSDKDTTSKKLADNVLFFSIVFTGNGGNKSVYFAKEDGTVYSAYLSSTFDSIKVEQVEGLKNIVNISDGTSFDDMSGASTPIFTDINGNVYIR